MSSYIGKEPAYGVFSKQAETGDGSTTAYTLNYTTADATQLIVSVGGVLQEPRIAYTINAAGNTLTFTEAPISTTSIWIIWLGRQLTGPRITADAITSQGALGTSPAAADTFLMYDENVGDLKKVAYSDLESDTANMEANTVKVRDAATTGIPSNKVVADTQILIGDGTGFTAAALSGDITMANTGAVTIANNAVDGAMIAIGSDAQGDVLYYNGSDYARLGAGTDGQFLKTQGASQNPVWGTVTTDTSGAWTSGTATTGKTLVMGF